MSKPEINIPTEFAANGTKVDFPNEKILSGFDPINPDILPGDCLNKFIDDTYKGLNGVLELYDGKVNKAGDTMTGNLQISSPVYPQIVIKDTEQVAGTTPTSVEQATKISFLDSNDTLVGYIQNIYGTDGSRVTMLNSRNGDGTEMANVIVGYNASGTAYCSFPNTTCCDGRWVNKDQTIMNDVNLHGTSILTYTLPLPNDGYNYEVLLSGNIVTGTTSGNALVLQVSSSIVGSTIICWTTNRGTTGASARSGGNVIIPVSSNHNIYVTRANDYTGTADLVMRGYRRIGTNS